MRERPAVIIDCDPGHDDTVALVVAAAYTDLVAVTTVSGNAPLVDVTRNALAVTELFAIGAPVHAGSPRPLVAPARTRPRCTERPASEARRCRRRPAPPARPTPSRC